MLESKVYCCLAFYASWKATLCLTMFTEFSIWKAGEGVRFFSPNSNKCKDVFNICVVQQNSSSQLCGIVVLMIFLLYIIPIQCLIPVHFFPYATRGLQLTVWLYPYPHAERHVLHWQLSTKTCCCSSRKSQSFK